MVSVYELFKSLFLISIPTVQLEKECGWAHLWKKDGRCGRGISENAHAKSSCSPAPETATAVTTLDKAAAIDAASRHQHIPASVK